MDNQKKKEIFPAALEDARAAELCPRSPQTLSAAYRLAFLRLEKDWHSVCLVALFNRIDPKEQQK